ncbi:hypothetical protein LY76DRAFT_272555 [Colletotrichum caudatum]|nr:hypothetical protein LY76DRAFT_272555 [Colletotrichum caudatum]
MVAGSRPSRGNVIFRQGLFVIRHTMAKTSGKWLQPDGTGSYLFLCEGYSCHISPMIGLSHYCMMAESTSAPLSNSLSTACYVPTASEIRGLGSTDAPIAIGGNATLRPLILVGQRWIVAHTSCQPAEVACHLPVAAVSHCQSRCVLPSPYALPPARLHLLIHTASGPSCRTVYAQLCHPLETPPPWRAWDWDCLAG